MKTVEAVVKIPKFVYDMTKAQKKVIDADVEIVGKAIANGTVLHENHGKIVDLGNIDRDKIEQDNPVITININDMAIEAVSLDYLDNLPDLTKKEE